MTRIVCYIYTIKVEVNVNKYNISAMPRKNITINDLAGMVKKGFDGVDKRFDGVDKRFDGVDKRFNNVEARLRNLEDGQEEIKLKLDQVAYRFEVVELQKRLKRVEARLGIK